MIHVDKQALRNVAENATPGEWCTDECHGVIADAGLNANYYIASCSGPEHRANTRYIAAANPATMLALLNENEALEKRVIGMEDDVRNIIELLDANEWAEHCTRTRLGQRLELQVTRLIGALSAAGASKGE
ncbi:ead/Ea22-like family protein [Edwardsiella piscicida]|nr:ead/Ea22-like family protein [Edwardsiella piscicida]